MSTRISSLVAAAVLVAGVGGWPGTAYRALTRAPGRAAPSFAEPSLSPDGKEIAFVSGGDIWTVPVAGGEAHLLVSDPASESRPLYSPDGTRLAFVSTRTGNGDIYELTLATGAMRRLTFDDVPEQLDAWSRDGQWLYFSSSAHDISGMTDEYRVSAAGGTPMPVAGDRYAAEFMGNPAPDGSALAIAARGVSQSQWWRKGRSHLDESELWLVHMAAAGARDALPRYEQLTPAGAKQQWPMWTADGQTLYFVSDRSGTQNVWAKPLRGAARQITRFTDGRVVWPTISWDGRTIAFERDFGIWLLDVASGQAKDVPIILRGASATPSSEHVTLTNQFQSLALSPDGKKVAFIAHGEVFASSSRDNGEATRITNTPAAEAQVAWSPNSRQLVYASQRDGPWHLFAYDFGTRAESQLTRGEESDISPSFSPDGKSIVYVHGGRELRLLDQASKQDHLLAHGFLDRMPFVATRRVAWSPDGRWLAYRNTIGSQFSNLFVIPTSGCPASGCEAHAVSFVPNVFGNSVAWSPDGTYLLFDTGQRTENGEVVRIDLVPRTPKFREDRFRDLFRDETPRPAPPAEPQPAKPSEPERRDSAASRSGDTASKAAAARRPDPVFDGIHGRSSVLPLGLDVGSVSISPDGKSALLAASAAGQQNLYVYSLDELSTEPAVARQLTSTAGTKSNAQWSPDSKEVFYLENGRITAIPVESRQPRTLAVSAELDVDFDREKMAVFDQAWSLLNDNFFDPKFNGVSWQAVHDDYAPRIAGARSPDEMRRLLNLMVGELNASHSGVGGPPVPGRTTTGRLGMSFDRSTFETDGKLRITDIVPLGPSALSRSITVGEYLLAVDGTAIEAHTNLDELLDHKIDRRVTLRIAKGVDGSGGRDVVVRPVNGATEKGLLYRAWVESRRDYVTKASNGRLGYVHLPDMGAQALQQFYLDLDSENRSRQGVVVDVRNNNGGFVNPYAIDVLARRGYMNMTYRGMPPAPARTVLGQRALEGPTVLVTNQHSLSDAEDFTEGYRALKLGPVVGEPTAGWIIYTSSGQLLDGSSVRLPFIRITDRNGADMELHPRPVDVLVERPMGESYTGRDSQLDAAVRELLRQLGRTASRDQ